MGEKGVKEGERAQKEEEKLEVEEAERKKSGILVGV